jgi:RNA polymerase sigma-70 factor (ECF subfamily)
VTEPGGLSSEHALIARIQRGDAEAFRELYYAHSRAVYRYVALKIGQPQEAEDITADTFIKAWQAFPRYKPGQTPVAAWLLRIAHNIVIDRYRQKRPSLLPFLWDRGGVEPHFSAIDDRDVIRRGFNTLSYDEQVILYLHYFDERTIKEIAQFMSKTANAVQVAEFRALRKLRRELADER